jgi:hypothetical protein
VPASSAVSLGSVDYDLHGLLGLRLIDPAESDLAAVSRQIGFLSPRSLAREPDIRIRYVDRLRPRGLRYLDGNRSGFSDEGFFLRAPGNRLACVRIPFDTLGSECEFVCERGAGEVPLLREAIGLAAIRKGLAPVHASAFDHRGVGVLVAGWPHGGKTSSLLAFTENGASFIADDLVFLAGDGGMYGTRLPLELADWQVRQIPLAWRQAGPAHRFAWYGLHALDSLAATTGLGGGGGGGSFTGRVLRALRRRLRLRLPAEAICPRIEGSVATASRIVFLLTHETSDIRVETADPEEMTQRLLTLARHERQPLLENYLAYQCAFPGRPNDLIERVDEMEAALLRSIVAGGETYVVCHPRPVSLRRLYEAMSPFCEASQTDERARFAMASP